MTPSTISGTASVSNSFARSHQAQFSQDSVPLVHGATIAAIAASNPDNQQGPSPNLGVKASGLWSMDTESRVHLPQQLLANLHTLATYSKDMPEAKSLYREISQVWNCLSEAEKVDVLKRIARQVGNGVLSSVDAPTKGIAMRWLRSTLKTTPAAERGRLLRFLNERQEKTIRSVVFNKPDATMVDTLFDYKAFLKSIDCIGTLPENCYGKRVAIVGSGLAGSPAAFELQKIVGLEVVIIEASDRLGGRLFSRHFKNPDGSEAREFSEMGGMRFSPVMSAFFHYLKLFNIETAPDFPNPGTVPTALDFKGEVTHWRKEQDKPDHQTLKAVAEDFSKFYKKLTAPMEKARNENDREAMRQIWQGYIDKYEKQEVSFLDGLTAGLEEIGIKWSEEEIAAFGAQGIGTGGFGSLYELSFLEVLNIILNKLETNQQLIVHGTSTVIDKFYSTKVERPHDGRVVSLRENADIRLRTMVTGIAVVNGQPELTMTCAGGESVKEKFDAVIVATTPEAMKQMGLTSQSDTKLSPLDTAVASAIEDLHMVSSSKTFFRTKTKFWKDNPAIPQVILSDQKEHMLYCLDYPWTEQGIVLASYTWEDKASEWTGMPEKERMTHIFKWIKRVSPPMAEALEQEFGSSLERLNPDDIHCIDWHDEPNYKGAFKLNKPGQAEKVHKAYYEFQKGKKGNGIIPASDSLSWNGGWGQGAVTSGLNAALGVLEYLGGKAAKGSPMTEMDPTLYNYAKN